MSLCPGKDRQNSSLFHGTKKSAVCHADLSIIACHMEVLPFYIHSDMSCISSGLSPTTQVVYVQVVGFA